MLATWPALMPLITPILGATYAEFECWGLMAYLLKQGWDIDLSQEPGMLNTQLVEVWFRGDPRPVQTLVQPWDCLALSIGGLVGDHCGVVCDAQTIVHTRRHAGVALDQLKRWEGKIMQVNRLRRLV